MNRLEIVDDFDEVKSIARQIDEGIRSLDQKLSSCSRFGLSLKPEETRMKAENLLKNMSEEIDCMKCNVESCLDEQKQILIDTIADNNSIGEYIEKTRREVNELEESFRSKKDYQPFIPRERPTDEATKECSFDAEDSLRRASSDSDTTNVDFYSSKKIRTAVKRDATAYHNSPGSIDSTLDELSAPVNFRLPTSNKFKPRILNIADDTLRTPGNFTVTKSNTKKYSNWGI